MRKSLLFISLLVSSVMSLHVEAQGVAINNTGATPDNSAMLEVKSSGKGMLIPRLSLTGTGDIITVPSPAVSLLVYNTATAGDVVPGYYYWSGTLWKRLATIGAAGEAWGINGNSGTNAAVNFIGTTDLKPLVFKVNNSKAGLIDPIFMNVTLGVGAGQSLAGVSFPTHNIFIGNNAGMNTTGGQYNCFIGGITGQANVTGTGNSFFGFDCGPLNIGNGNSFFGLQAGGNNVSGENNTFVGVSAGTPNSGGSSNTVLGANAGLGGPSLINATVIGADAISNSSNSLILGSINGVHGATSDVNVGIGTSSPDTKLEVAGSNGVTSRLTSSNSGDVNFDFKRTGSDWRIRNSSGLLFIGQSSDDLASVTDVLRLGGSSVTPAADNVVTLGSTSLRWTQVCAVNGTVNTSDERLKKDISALRYGMDALMKLKPVTFMWKNGNIDNGTKHLGFLAQDLQKVLPEVVVDHEWQEVTDGGARTWSQTSILGVNYAEITPVLVKAIQEQQIIIEQLQKEIAAMKQQIGLLNR